MAGIRFQGIPANNFGYVIFDTDSRLESSRLRNCK